VQEDACEAVLRGVGSGGAVVGEQHDRDERGDREDHDGRRNVELGLAATGRIRNTVRRAHDEPFSNKPGPGIAPGQSRDVTRRRVLRRARRPGP
jgi:hypothetical protein